jgi:uncharacterized protein YegL
MSNEDYKTDDDLVTNTTARIPVCLCIDTSGSMSQFDDMPKRRIERLADGIEEFYKEIADNPATHDSAEIALLSFNVVATLVQDFVLVDGANRHPTFAPKGKGDLGMGVNAALDALQARKDRYKANGVEYYQPLLIIMSDGHSTGSNTEVVRENLANAHQRAIEMENAKKLTVIPIYVSFSSDSSCDDKAMSQLGGFSKVNSVKSVNSVSFTKFFRWLGKSVGQIQMAGDPKSGQTEVDYSGLEGDFDDI